MTGHINGHFYFKLFNGQTIPLYLSINGHMTTIHDCDLAVNVMCCYIYRSVGKSHFVID